MLGDEAPAGAGFKSFQDRIWDYDRLSARVGNAGATK